MSFEHSGRTRPTPGTRTEARRLEVYVDPACPWSWITAHWLAEVAGVRGLELDWRSFSLRIRDGDQPSVPPPLREVAIETSRQSLRLLRVFEALRDAGRADAVQDLYLAWGQRVFVPGPPSAPGPELVGQVVEACGLDASWAAHADDEDWDTAINRSMERLAAMAGPAPSIPMLVVDQDTPVAFAGPVLSPAPQGARALRIWDAVADLLDEPGFFGLSRPYWGVVPAFPPVPALRG